MVLHNRHGLWPNQITSTAAEVQGAGMGEVPPCWSVGGFRLIKDTVVVLPVVV